MNHKKFFGLFMAVIMMFTVFGAVACAKQVEFLPEDTANWQQNVQLVSTVEPAVYNEVPLYNQFDYPTTPYGNYGTVASHGCGVACLAMVSTYLLDKPYLPSDAAKDFGAYNTSNGSLWDLFEGSAEILGLKLQTRTWKTDEVMTALKNGQVVVSLQDVGLFTGGGHFIVLTGLTDDGRILVNDPNGYNYTKNETLKNGFQNGFAPGQIFAAGGPYWIYDKKPATEQSLTQLGSAIEATIHNTFFTKEEM